MLGFWSGDGLIHLAGGAILAVEVESYAARPDDFVDLLLSAEAARTATAASRALLCDHARSVQWWDRTEIVGLALLLPEVHVA